jgi:hypothetical protein
MSNIRKSVTDMDKEVMYHDFCTGMSLVDISKKHDVSYRSIIRYAQEGDWKSRRELQLAGVDEVDLKPSDLLQSEAIDKALRVLHKIATDTEIGLFGGNPELLRTNVKTMVDAIDKLVRLKMHVESGGVDKREVHVKKESMDWNKIIEMSVKAKKEKGDNFDEEEFLRNVMDKGGK